MNTASPLPLPADRIPPGVADWRSADARRWLATVPGAWAHPLWAVLLLALTTVWMAVAFPDPVCTPAEPCGADWAGTGVFAALLLTLYWVVRQPRLALLGLAVVLLGHLEEGWSGSMLAEPWWLAFVGALAFTAAGLLHRLAVAARQRALAAEAAGPAAHPVPPAALRFRRGRLSFVLAAPLLAVAVYGFWQAQQVADAHERRAAGLAPVSGRVTLSDEDELVIAVAVGDRVHRVDTYYPERYPVDSRAELLVDGDWARLAAEPYDVVGWELLVLAGLVGGLAFLANGVDGRTRSRQLHQGPLPVLRVLVREGHDDGRTWVYAADDPAAERPLLHFHSLHAFEEDEEDEENGRDGQGDGRRGPHGEDDDGADGDDELAEGLRRVGAILKGEDPPPPVREAVLYGLPYTGTELAFVAPDGDDPDEVAVECSVTAVRPAVRGLLGGGLPGPAPDGRAGRPGGGQRPGRRPVDEVAATLEPSTAPRTWGANGVSRAVGGVLLLAQAGGVWALLEDDVSWLSVFPLIGLFFVVTSASTVLNWRITADRDGLWIAGPWRVRRVLWGDVEAVRHNRGGDLVVVRERDTEVTLSPVGWPWMERRLGREPYGPRAADEAHALLRRPELRPLEEAGPSQQGMPLGPLVAAVSALWGAAVLLLL
ncbi:MULTISPECIES: hypothetical protein [Streptomyces]|uniref:Uncharacterized protein n=1 Tax=Streptomyces fradiae ATCC 10745 = DSM 40063 TaxID=1319510 RepID=A0A1Y2P340_STRFR|nr:MULTISPECIES: hypothetical protein [Streptomyces]KAF0647326.1 hypothetical protein K701_24240 [Streptomyces fradiae ATCC 10745 = DSM 40063]OSY54243.1 hypothetical protein BG846_00079 [Streptomyces fradiae ATCC 10745 = DSM 40063]QEV13750.1 hypothetical protein CP974_19130 [Streptomyces fradiae ATCC 10745 = DSM 40063]UQS31007.1 hypothetical protein J5J01_04675 [Streptomyces fradiae]